MRKAILLSISAIGLLGACIFSPSLDDAKVTSNYFLAHLIVDTPKALKVVKQDPETIEAVKNISQVFSIKKQTLGVQNVRFKHLRTTLKGDVAVSVFTQIYDGRVASDNLTVTMEPQGEHYWVVVSIDAK